jgi:hypothetical protein
MICRPSPHRRGKAVNHVGTRKVYFCRNFMTRTCFEKPISPGTYSYRPRRRQDRLTLESRMKFLIYFLAAGAFVSASSASNTATHCSLDSKGSDLSIVFQTTVGGVTVTGDAQTGPFGVDLSLSFTSNGARFLSYIANLTSAASTAKWAFSSTGGNATFTMTNGIIDGIVDDITLTPFTPSSPKIGFANGTTLGPLPLPDQIGSILPNLPVAIKAVLAICQLSQDSSSNGTTPFVKRQETLGVPPAIDDPEGKSACHLCIIGAYADAVLCGLDCAASFLGIPFASCDCVSLGPLNVARCHEAGAACCPVPCGPSHSILGVDVIYQCCDIYGTCSNPANGACCGGFTRPCGNSICCLPGTTCIESEGLCCPVGAPVCPTPQGDVCCDVGDVCVGNNGCCPSEMACNQVCCEDPFNPCSDHANSFCCAATGINSGGICCLPNQFNCQGSCCQGTCDISGCHFTPANTDCPSGIACPADGNCLPSGGFLFECSQGCCAEVPK